MLVGFLLWLAENAATLLRAWQYPPQESVWSVVHVAKLGARTTLSRSRSCRSADRSLSRQQAAH